MYWHVGQVVGAGVVILGFLYGAGVFYVIAREFINDRSNDHHWREDMDHPIFRNDRFTFEWGDRWQTGIMAPMIGAMIGLISVPLWPIPVVIFLIVGIMISLRNEKRKAKEK